MAKFQFYPIDLTYKIIKGTPNVYIYGRSADEKRICLVDQNFEPYFYIVPKNDQDQTVLNEKLKEFDAGTEGSPLNVVRTEIVSKMLDGRNLKVIKVVTNIPKAVLVLRKEFKNWSEVEDILEYDIPFTRRYLIDKKITPLVLTDVEAEKLERQDEETKVPLFDLKSISQSSDDSLKGLKTLAFDIETYNPEGRLIIAEKHPIVMISLYSETMQKVLTWKRFDTDLDYIEFLDGEADMLERFKELIDEAAPDVITGYYSDGFDFPYIIKRAEKYKIKLDISLNHDIMHIPRGRNTSIDTTGIIHIDILNFIRRVIARTLKTDSMKLDDVAAELLGEKKDDVDIEKLADAWDKCSAEELDRFARYNLKDSKLTFELFQKIEPNLIELVKIVSQAPRDVNRMSFSQLVEMYLMRRADDFGQFIPNKPHNRELNRRKSERIKGAFVFEPKPGLYEKVAVFDFRSLYPTIIVSHNISIETLNCDCCKGKDSVPIDNKTLWFCTRKKGFFSTVLKDIITRRMRVKKILKQADPDKRMFLDARQNSLKLLANSFYGYLGFFAARWYTKDSARSVTAYGRYYINKVIDEAGVEGFDVLYSDTDSIFIHLKEKKTADALKFCDNINKSLPGVMELEYEGTYRRALFVGTKDADIGAKKRYAMIDDKGVMTIKGFETVRRNVSQVAKDVQKEVLKILLDENDPEKAFEYAREVIKRLKEHSIDIKDLAILTRLTKSIDSYESIGPHVAAAKRMKAKGIEVYPGMIIRYVVTKGTGSIGSRARLPEETKKEEYDSEYYIKNQVIPAVDNIFEVFGRDADELSDGKKQSKLMSYL